MGKMMGREKKIRFFLNRRPPLHISRLIEKSTDLFETTSDFIELSACGILGFKKIGLSQRIKSTVSKSTLMKNQLATTTVLLALAAHAHAAATVAYSATASPSLSPDGSGSTNVWNTSILGSNAGFFLGDSGSNGDGNGAGAGTSAWAMFANNNDQAFSNHTFVGGALTNGQTVGLNFDNGFFDSTKSAGIQLRSGSTVLFSLYFRGGQSFYEYLDAGGTDIDTTRGFSDDGAAFSFTLNSATTYSASYGSANWSGTITSSAVDNIQVFNNSAGSGSTRDVYFNNLTVVPEPASAALGLIGSVLLLRRRRN